MITASLKKEQITNYTILAIPDIHDPPNWVRHVVSIIGEFDVVFTYNTITKRLFADKDYTVVDLPPYQREKYRGSIIRDKIKKDQPWESLVPPSVAKIITAIDGVQRIQNVS